MANQSLGPLAAIQLEQFEILMELNEDQGLDGEGKGRRLRAAIDTEPHRERESQRALGLGNRKLNVVVRVGRLSFHLLTVTTFASWLHKATNFLNCLATLLLPRFFCFD